MLCLSNATQKFDSVLFDTSIKSSAHHMNFHFKTNDANSVSLLNHLILVFDINSSSVGTGLSIEYIQLTSSDGKGCQDSRVESARTAPVIGAAAGGMCLFWQAQFSTSAGQLKSERVREGSQQQQQWSHGSTDRGQCRIKVDWHDQPSVHVQWTAHN